MLLREQVKVIVENIQVALGALLQVVGDAACQHHVVHHLMSEEASTLLVTFAELIELDDDWMIGIDL